MRQPLFPDTDAEKRRHKAGGKPPDQEVIILNKKKGMSLLAKQKAAGWVFLLPATILIFVMSFYPMVQAFVMSLQTGSSANLKWANPITFN